MKSNQFVNNEFYHIYCRGVEKRRIFSDKRDYQRFLLSLEVFNAEGLTWISNKFSPEVDLPKFSDDNLVDISSYCLMPNHYHLLLRQKVDNGITKFMRKINTGYTMYFNLKNERTGRLFESRFKSVHVDSDRYLKHLWNYIHLNPLDLINKDWRSGEFEDTELTLRFIKDYPWSSYKFFDNSTIKSNILNKDILDYGINVGDSILEWPSRNLESISHLTLEG